jgi:hypothetical protein
MKLISIAISMAKIFNQNQLQYIDLNQVLKINKNLEFFFLKNVDSILVTITMTKSFDCN